MSIQPLSLRNNASEDSQQRREKPSRKNSLSYSQLDSSKKSITPEWLVNPVLVLKKKNIEWRMCVDYTDLNKHCPKDPFGLSRIDQVIDSTAGCV